MIRVVVDGRALVASIDLVGHGDEDWTPEEAAAELERRPLRDDIAPDPLLPADTALWARLQSASGGLWGGCVYDAEAIVEIARRGRRAGDTAGPRVDRTGAPPA